MFTCGTFLLKCCSHFLCLSWPPCYATVHTSPLLVNSYLCNPLPLLFHTDMLDNTIHTFSKCDNGIFIGSLLMAGYFEQHCTRSYLDVSQASQSLHIQNDVSPLLSPFQIDTPNLLYSLSPISEVIS